MPAASVRTATVLVIDWRAVAAEHQRRHPLNTSHTDQWSDAERELQDAIEDFKRECRRPFPTWTEFLAVILALGYRKALDAPRYNRSSGNRLMRGQRTKPEPIPFPRRNRGGVQAQATVPPVVAMSVTMPVQHH